MTIEEVARGFTDLRSSDVDRFDEMAEAVLAYQRMRNRVYARYCKAMATPAGTLPTFMPVEAFRRAEVTTFPPEEAALVFESSRTGRSVPSRHFIRDPEIYQRSAAGHFARVFGDGPFRFATYLPGYEQDRRASSLLFMVDHLVERFGSVDSGACLNDPRRLQHLAERSDTDGIRLIVFGAAFGLLDLVERHSFSLPAEAFVVETGGMKTHRREVRRDELHERLADGFGLPPSSVRSEYGMCELLSQCYTRGEGVFYPPPWMRMWVVDPERPFEGLADGERGALAVLDLANMYSASALVTQDRAVRRGEGFEILGRLRGAELRGCNFLLEHVQPP